MRIDFIEFSANSPGPKPDALPDCATLRTVYVQYVTIVRFPLSTVSAQFPAQFREQMLELMRDRYMTALNKSIRKDMK